MKITIYELLGLIKDSKAPEKIKYEYLIYELTPEKDNYYCKNMMRWFTNEINSLEVLNNEVEIIEEPKKIEKTARCDDAKMTHYGELYKPTENEEILRLKVNEIIDEINKIKEK